MAIPIASFMLEDFLFLNHPISHLIITTLAAIHSHHLLVAYNPLQPQHHDTSCKKSVSTCQYNREAGWWDGLACHYLDPDFPPLPQDMPLKVEKSLVQGVTTACQLEVLCVIKEQ